MLSPAIVPPTSRIWSTFIGPSLFSRSCWTDTCEAAFSGGERNREPPPEGSRSAAVRGFAPTGPPAPAHEGGGGEGAPETGPPAKTVSHRKPLWHVATKP